LIRLPSKKLALIIIICILAVGTVTANVHGMTGCCVQADSRDLRSGAEPNGHVLVSGCCASLKNSPCYLMSDLALEARVSAISSVPRAENSASVGLAATEAGGFFFPDSPRYTADFSRIFATGRSVPLYLRNLSLLI
jgi:hypothetical protein